MIANAFVTCPECGRELQVWPHPDFPDERPAVRHLPGDLHEMDWPSEQETQQP